jgi:hypothetical protein
MSFKHTTDGVQTNVTTIFSGKNDHFRKNAPDRVDIPCKRKYFVRWIIQPKWRLWMYVFSIL